VTHTTTTSAVDAELVARLRISVARLSRLLRQQDESGLTPTTTALLATIARIGPLTLGELAAHEQVAPPTITKSVGKLEEHGLVERIPDPHDRRVCRVQLTPEGRERFAANRVRRDAWLAERLDTLTARQRDRIGHVVDLLEHLSEPSEAR
jgi:DNA-binding MarR family transcriptional regulator